MSPKISLSSAQWIKSSHSDGDGGQCVEAAFNFTSAGVVPIRDSKDPAGPALTVPADAWQAFVTGVKAGIFPTR
ncbi:DUF397 domain-containing protein [Kitasatospora saccharophila]|uniref:DUF397 domain-containing protein n=1 Tax=Kitasatospora saccharophila TaxID=407973 RepID=UPI0031E33EAE